jgi:hypothetical protein
VTGVWRAASLRAVGERVFEVVVRREPPGCTLVRDSSFASANLRRNLSTARGGGQSPNGCGEQTRAPSHCCPGVTKPGAR